ncbi:MAG: hypothetical protein FWH44_05685 [Methanomassiliicoccaceae archaeon]|nr:hypothetical protein [Methanomassiliicoccaceae archaeon]
MNLENSTSFVLRYGSVIGIIIVAMGLMAHLADISHSDTMMTAGILIIVLTPFAGMLVSFTSLSVNRERAYAVIALILIAITVIGMVVAFLLV